MMLASIIILYTAYMYIKGIRMDTKTKIENDRATYISENPFFLQKIAALINKPTMICFPDQTEFLYVAGRGLNHGTQSK